MKELEVVAIIDDEEPTRKALVRILTMARLHPFPFASANEFLKQANNLRILCVISDMRMPGIDGFSLQAILKGRMPHVGFVFVTGYADVPSSVRAMKSGAVDFLAKPVKKTELLEVIERAVRQTRCAENRATELDELKNRQRRLTQRESEVFALVSAGLLNKQIAAEFRLSIKTVKQHRGVVMKKMKADSTADLAIMADRLGIRPSYLDFARARGMVPSS
jgi:FixJ family two-component response regulator